MHGAPEDAAPQDAAPTDDGQREAAETLESELTENTCSRAPPMSDTLAGSDFDALNAFDPEIAGVLVSELERIRGGLQLIAN